jgi:hypothetical protein
MSLEFFKIQHGLGKSFVGIEQGGLANLSAMTYQTSE